MIMGWNIYSPGGLRGFRHKAEAYFVVCGGTYAVKLCLNEIIFKINFLVGLELLRTEQEQNTISQAKVSDHSFFYLSHSSSPEYMMSFSSRVAFQLRGVLIVEFG